VDTVEIVEVERRRRDTDLELAGAGYRQVDVVELQDVTGRPVSAHSPGLHKRTLAIGMDDGQRSRTIVRGVREAPTIVLIGAGSASFGVTTLHDLYADPVFAGATVRLVDLEPACLDRMANVAGALEAATSRGITIERLTERVDALPGADAVVVSVEVDRINRWLLDFDIPRRHGIDHVYGENGGPGGLSHALRTIPRATSSGLHPTRCWSTSPTPRAGSARPFGATSTSP
jgi:hypothetical protein